MREFCLYILLFTSCTLAAQVSVSSLDISQLNNQISDSLQTKQTALNWQDMDTQLLWSALSLTDSIAIIGFKPPAILNEREAITTNNFSNSEWTAARKNLRTFILNESRAFDSNLSATDLFLNSTDIARPYIYAKIHSASILQSLRTAVNIRYVEPANFEYLGTANRSGEGCSDYSVVVDANDYSAISPSAIASWTQAEHMIDLAWPKSNKGAGVWIAVMDTGISNDNPKFNTEFDEGESAGRFIEKKGFYAPNGTNDGVDDQCGHGTAMAGLAVGTRGFNNTPAGVSYQANLISYRVTNDVIINASAEIDGLHDGLYDAADDTRVSVISISLGDILPTDQLRMALFMRTIKEN